MDPRAGESEQVYEQRERYIESLERSLNQLMDSGMVEMMKNAELRMRQERLRQHFSSFEEADKLYRQVSVLVTGETYHALEERYIIAMALIRERLEEGGGDQRSGRSSIREELAGPSSTVIKVETMQPPRINRFNGDPADWPAFRDLFLAEVHNRNYDPVNKLLYLQQACTGKAAVTLGPWQLTSDNYAAAWETLMRTYNDDYHVIHSILGKLQAVGRQGQETYDSLRVVLDSVTSGTRQLETIAPQHRLWDQFWIHHAKQRLPRDTLDAWEQHRNSHSTTDLPTLEQFKDFLDVRSKGKREVEGEVVPAGNQEFRKPIGIEQRVTRNERFRSASNTRRFQPYKQEPFDRSNDNNSQFERMKSEPQQVRCVMQGCTTSHKVEDCAIFRQRSLPERWTVVYRNRLCRCCLKPGHTGAECNQEGCTSCQGGQSNHHFMLCNKARHNLQQRFVANRSGPPNRP